MSDRMYPIDLRTYTGWARPCGAARVHYYNGQGVSLCKHSKFMNTRGKLDEDVLERCRSCVKRVGDKPG